MDTYLLMLYVTFQQEKAIQELFRKKGWEFSKLDLKKTTSELGPLVAQTTADDEIPEPTEASELPAQTLPNPDDISDMPARKRLKIRSHEKKMDPERVIKTSTASKVTSVLAEAIGLPGSIIKSSSGEINTDDPDYGDEDDDFEDNLKDGKLDQQKSLDMSNDNADVVHVDPQSSTCQIKGRKKVIDLRNKKKRQGKRKGGAGVLDELREKVDGTSAEDGKTDTVTLVELEEDPVSMTTRRSGRVRKLTEKLLNSPYNNSKSLLSTENPSTSVRARVIVKTETDGVNTESEHETRWNEEKSPDTAVDTSCSETDIIDVNDDISYLDLKTEPVSDNDFVATEKVLDDGSDDKGDSYNEDDYKALDSDTDDDYVDEVLEDIAAATAAAAKQKQNRQKRGMKDIKSLPYKCETCENAFTSLAYLKKHEVRVHDLKMPENKPFTCKVCGHKYFFERHMLMHMLDRHGVSDPEKVERSFTCDLCGKSFFLHRCYIHHMNAHKEKEKKPNAYICDLCGKHFNRSDTLNWHKKAIHYGIKRPRISASLLPKKFVCDKCDRGFKRQQHLKDHIAVWHDPAGRKYKCDECSEMFIRPHQVQYHINKVHLKQKPYKCSICNLGFYSAVSLRKHYIVCSKSHLNLHQCKECGKNFSNERNLEMHAEAIHSKNPLTCECGTVVKWRSSWAKHKRKCRLNPDNCEQILPVKHKSQPLISESAASALAGLEGPFKIVGSQIEAGTSIVDVENTDAVSVSRDLHQNSGRPLDQNGSDATCIDGAGADLSLDKWSLTETGDIPPEAVEILKQSHIELDGTVQYDVSSIIEQQDEAQNSVYYTMMIEMNKSVMSGSLKNISAQFIGFAKQVQEMYKSTVAGSGKLSGNEPDTEDSTTLTPSPDPKNDHNSELSNPSGCLHPSSTMSDDVGQYEPPISGICLEEGVEERNKETHISEEVDISLLERQADLSLAVSEVSVDVKSSLVKKDKFTCDLCNKGFSRQYTLNRHRKSHQNGLEKCTVCNMYFDNFELLEIHNQKFHSKELICKLCDSCFCRKSSLVKHMRTIHPMYVNPKFVCIVPECKAAFDSQEALLDHLNIHDGLTPYSCKHCQAMFAQRSDVVKHEDKVHKEPVPIQCEDCGKTFSSQGALCNHRQSVHENRIFTCTLCNKSFKYRSGYSRHMLVHQTYQYSSEPEDNGNDNGEMHETDATENHSNIDNQSNFEIQLNSENQSCQNIKIEPITIVSDDSAPVVNPNTIHEIHILNSDQAQVHNMESGQNVLVGNVMVFSNHVNDSGFATLGTVQYPQ